MIVSAVADLPSQGAVTLRVGGEVDLTEKEALCAAIVGCAYDGTCMVVLDLASVTYLGSSGLSALLTGRRILEERGIPLYIDECSEITERLLQLTGLWERFSRVSTEPAA
jgi:anti-sigma B factor antagonist